MPPNRSLPASLVARLAVAVLWGLHRSFQADAAWLSAARGVPARVIGREHIPVSGPGIITINHYHSPTFWAPWLAVSIAAGVPAPVYWTMADAWTFPGWRLARPLRTASHWVLPRLAAVYGFNSMPPMPPTEREVAERAASVQRMVRFARQNPNHLIGLAPEGGDQPGGRLALPPEGAGRLALALARRDTPIYPAGIYEESNGSVSLCFGPPYFLHVDPSGDRPQVDLQARLCLARAIAACLPEHLRGPFQD